MWRITPNEAERPHEGKWQVIEALKILGVAVLSVGGPALLIWLLWWGVKERPE